MSARPFVILAVSLALAPAAARGAEPPVTIENVRVGLDGTFKTASWTPVWVDLKAGDAPFEGVLEVETPDEDGTPTRVRRPVALRAHDTSLGLVLYIRPGSRNAEIVARVRDARGRVQTRDHRPDDPPNGRPPTVLGEDQAVVLGLGQPQGLIELVGQVTLALPPGPAQGTATGSDLAVVRPRPSSLPARWYGFDMARAIVLDTNDQDVMDALRTRGEALRQWVRQGGHLVVAVGERWQLARELLGDLLPAEPAGTTRLNDVAEIEAFAGSNAPIVAPGQAMTVARLAGAERRGGKVLAASAETPLVVRGPYGFGRVTLVGLNVDQKPFADWKDKVRMWIRLLDLRTQSEAEVAAAASATSGGAVVRTGATDLSSILFRFLDRPPGVTLVPFGWVAFFVFLYILMIGPGDYFFLKKVLKRMELTWITFPIIVLTVSLLAYAAAYRLKGTDLKLSTVELVDVDQESGLVRGTSWFTLFSPQNQDYDVSVVPLSLDADAPADAPVPERPPAGTERLMSWFGPTDPRFGGGYSTRMSLSGSGYVYGPMGELETLQRVRVPIWSTKSFVGRWSAPAAPTLIESDLVAEGSERVTGRLTNRSQRMLRNAVLFFGDHAYDQLGTIAPGASVVIDSTTRVRPLSGYLEQQAQGLAQYAEGYTLAPYSPNQPANFGRAELLRTLMFREGMNPKTGTPGNVVWPGLDLSGQLALDRPMLVAELDGPVTAVSLGGAPSEPKTDRTTVLRVILPVRPEGAMTGVSDRGASSGAGPNG